MEVEGEKPTLRPDHNPSQLTSTVMRTDDASLKETLPIRQGASHHEVSGLTLKFQAALKLPR